MIVAKFWSMIALIKIFLPFLSENTYIKKCPMSGGLTSGFSDGRSMVSWVKVFLAETIRSLYFYNPMF
ncbi:MAG: hypothetical protein AUJ12_08020 [Alphaproteobacteria bacterium CG1_02_46_17]|nr:MAG: hypothetical protein AUJ12_08020 [Alphaproteobacteria bacterium CG1_02_46_17]